MGQLKNQPDLEKTAKNTRRFPPWLGWLAAAGALSGAGIVAGPLLAATPKPAPTPLTSGPRLVQIAAVEAAPLARTQRFSGALRARRSATLGFLLSGRLVGRKVELGAKVKRGQVLATLDARELNNALRGSTAALDEVTTRKRQMDRDALRTDGLWRAGVATEQEHERVQAQKSVLGATQRATEVRLRESRRLLSETVLRAPFDGTVVAVHGERGELVGPTMPVVEISGDDRLELEVAVPEQTLAKLQPNTSVVVDLPIMGARGMSGVVSRIGSAAAGAGRLFPVVIDLVDPDPDARPGMTAEVALPVSAKAALSVPVAAVRDPSGTAPKVMRLEGDAVHEVPVRVFELLTDRVLVQGELRAGDRVVVAGHAFLLDGDHVAVAETAP
jgi:RND family efflux transporter MFP subunit